MITVPGPGGAIGALQRGFFCGLHPSATVTNQLNGMQRAWDVQKKMPLPDWHARRGLDGAAILVGHACGQMQSKHTWRSPNTKSIKAACRTLKSGAGDGTADASLSVSKDRKAREPRLSRAVGCIEVAGHGSCWTEGEALAQPAQPAAQPARAVQSWSQPAPAAAAHT